ncbi:uncharacterized protein LOC142230507 [Haematobia irritans]|uniref:uncharacterized protein LOC142230507 n=1 Tax=Haematobia irritans TaxID=7368 RepID=UPI003F4F44F7
MVDIFFNGLVVGSSGYALSQLQFTENPFIFSGCVVGLCHGLLGLYMNIVEGSSNSQMAFELPQSNDSMVRKLQNLTESCMEITIVPLVNIDLYLKSQQSSPLAMGHGLFIVPLAFDVAFKLFDTDGERNSADTLKELTSLGNIVSLVFLSVNESHLPYGLLAMSALTAQYGPVVMENILKGSGANISLMGYSLLFALIPNAVGI